jgi:4-hydroxyproline epimerase
MNSIQVIDSHTGGEPTRVVIRGGPALNCQPLADKVATLRAERDDFRRSVVLEPRGSDVMVGALLCEPYAADCVTGVIFFNNVGYLGMCGHGLIGVVATLAYLDRIGPGVHRVDTPAGVVEATLRDDGEVCVENVPSWRTVKDIEMEIPGFGKVVGDIVWGGNWFFLVKRPSMDLSLTSVDKLVALAWKIRQVVNACGYPEVDHVELFGRPRAGGDSRNFVLCPGKAYDRSPCGTGTSAKLACLAADGVLEEGAEWIQESIIGSQFRGSFRWNDRSRSEILPRIVGRAHIMAETTLIYQEGDPFASGIS